MLFPHGYKCFQTGHIPKNMHCICILHLDQGNFHYGDTLGLHVLGPTVVYCILQHLISWFSSKTHAITTTTKKNFTHNGTQEHVMLCITGYRHQYRVISRLFAQRYFLALGAFFFFIQSWLHPTYKDWKWSYSGEQCCSLPKVYMHSPFTFLAFTLPWPLQSIMRPVWIT